MKPLRLLIVEDDSAALEVLAASYRRILMAEGYEPSIQKCADVDEARKIAKSARTDPYDLVSLDVNLGDKTLTGLHVLATLKRFRSAWMVALLTGVETDAKLDHSMGSERGDELRKTLRREAYANFPAERLLVVEKPPAAMQEDDASRLLANRLKQIVLVYAEVSRLRYVFRPIEIAILKRIPVRRGAKTEHRFVEATAVHWQVSFNCSEIRTLPDMAGFRTLHHLLRLDRNQSVSPEEALAIEPKAEKKEGPISPPEGDPLAAYFESRGIVWRTLSPNDQQNLIKAALSVKITRYTDLRSFQEDRDISPAEEAELDGIKKELGPLADVAERTYLCLSGEGDAPSMDEEPERTDDKPMSVGDMHESGLHVDGGDYGQLGPDRRGLDSPTAMLFRARMKRVRDCLRENGLGAFAEHIANCIQGGGSRWSYSSPEGIEWTT